MTTRLLEDLDFPQVTICPKKGSNTALNPDLIKADNNSLTKEDRTKLQNSAFDIFTTSTYQKYVDSIMHLVAGNGNLKDVFDGFWSIPKPFGADGFEIRMWNNDGTFKTPGFKGVYKESYHNESKQYHVVLDFPEGLSEKIGNGSLIVEIEVVTRQEDGWLESVDYSEGDKFTLVTDTKEWADAEAYCQSRGAHLASVLNEEEFLEVKTIVVTSWTTVWLGGQYIDDVWIWSDGSPWNFTKFVGSSEKSQGTNHCLKMDESGAWTTATIWIYLLMLAVLLFAKYFPEL